MPKPTAAELIERIKQAIPHCTEGQDAGQLFYTTADKLDSFHCLLNTCIAHLSDPWVSVEERLPTEEECKTHNEGFNVLFRSKYCSDPIALGAYFHDGKFQFEEDDTGDFYVPDWGIFVAWCPLPPLPQKAGEE